MNEYSIIGSNISNSKLLFLKSNENDTKITIHNNSGYFETTYNNSNLIITNFNDKLHFKQIINDDNYINFHIDNNINLLLNYSFGEDNDDVDIKNINFNSINNQNKNDIDNDGQIYTSSFIFTKKVNDVGNYVCFETNNIIESNLTNLNFFDENLISINKSNIKGVIIVIKLDKKFNLEKIKWIFENNHTLPHKINIYSKLNNNLYKVYENLFFNDLNGDIQFNKFYNSDTYLLNIESVLLLKSYYDYIVNLNQSDNDFLNINQNNNIIKRENNIGEESQYSLALNLKNIEISKKTNNIINHYDIDMNLNNFLNINSISANKIILNNKIYDDIISQDTVVSVVTDIINNQNSLFEQIITETLDNNSINIDNLTQTFNPASLSESFINNKNYQKPESNLYIPFVEYFFENDFSTSIRVHYNSDVNIKHLVELSSLNNEDSILKHKNGTIYKDNKINNLIIDNNIEVNNDLIVDNKIIINSNVLEWNPELNKFKYSSNIQIQNSLFYSVKIEPIISNINIDSSNFSDSIFQYSYDNYKISHPSFRTYNLLAPNSYPELIFAYWLNNVNILKLILNHNIYLSARYGSSFNLIDNINNKYNLIKNDFIDVDINNYKFYYNGNEEYLDFFEYETTKPVLLKKISFYELSIKEFNYLGNEYKGNWNQYYTAQNKNNIDNFKILGSNDNRWDLIHSETNIQSIEHYDTYLQSFNINVEKKYKKYRFVFGGDDITLPYIIKDLRFYFEKTDNLNNIIYNESFIDKTYLNFLSINNQTDWDRSSKNNYIINNKNRTKLIINEDIDRTYQHNNSFAVIHINEEYNKLNYGIEDDNDIHMLRMSLNNNNIDNLYSVYHTLNLKNDSLYYVISPYNSLDDNRNINNNNIILGISKKETKDYEEKGITGINLSSERLSDMIDNSDNHINKCNGLVIDPKIRLCQYNNDNHSNILNGYLDIGINSNINIDNSYHINLPYNSSNIHNNSTFYLEIDNFDKSNKIINTKWGIVGESIFNSEKIYIGIKDNSNIHEQHLNIEYCNLDITTSNYIPENLLHIRKAFIGLPNNINKDIINDNVLTVGGQIYATTDVATDSDISYKFDFEQIINPKDKINKLTGYTFNRNDTTEKRRFCGLIAQDVEKILPEAIIKKHDGKLRVMYNNLASLFVECFKDLYKEIDELKKEVHICKEKL